MHVQSFGASGVGQLKAHIMRERESGHYGNENIDSKRTVQNYHVLEVGDWDETIAKRIAAHEAVSGKKLRKDANLISSVVVTLPEAYRAPKKGPLSRLFKRSEEKMQAERERAFFEASALFLQGVFGGADNVLCAEVHKDETSPHMHFTFIPVVKEGVERKGKTRKAGTISADAVVTRQVLLDLHPNLDKHLRKILPWYKGGVMLDGAEKEGAKYVDIAELKATPHELVKGARKVAGLAKQEKTLEAREEALEARESASREMWPKVKRALDSADAKAKGYKATSEKLSLEVESLRKENADLKEELKARPTREEFSKACEDRSRAEERARQAEAKALRLEARIAQRGGKTRAGRD